MYDKFGLFGGQAWHRATANPWYASPAPGAAAAAAAMAAGLGMSGPHQLSHAAATAALHTSISDKKGLITHLYDYTVYSCKQILNRQKFKALI